MNKDRRYLLIMTEQELSTITAYLESARKVGLKYNIPELRTERVDLWNRQYMKVLGIFYRVIEFFV